MPGRERYHAAMGRIDVFETLVVILCLPVYAVALPVMFVRRLFPRRCPKCCRRGLRNRGGMRASCVDTVGRRYPDFYTYYSCDHCGARLRIHRVGRTEEPSEEEWSSVIES